MYIISCLKAIKRAIATIIFIVFFVQITQAQKEYNIWYFGNMAGLDFNTTPPTAITSSNMYSLEGTSGICDRNGNLVLYTNDDSIYNYKHQLIKNGLYKTYKTSPIQGFMVLPHPSIPNNYYIFTSPDLSLYDDHIRYSQVDMGLNNGNGEVVVNDSPLILGSFERLAVTAHENERDYWIAGIYQDPNSTVYDSSYFSCTRTVNGNIGAVQPPQLIPGIQDAFNVKFSPSGSIFFGPRAYATNGSRYFTLYKFDRSTGLLSNSLNIPYAGVDQLLYLEFSADSRFVYMSYYYSLLDNELAQYDLSVWDSATITNSKKIIHSKGNYPAGMQFGPDKKIYVFHNSLDYLGVINNPEMSGNACQYIDSAIYLKGRFNVAGSPYYPAFWFSKYPINIGPDTTLCPGDSLVLDAKQPPDAKITWSTGDTSHKLTITQPGTYWVKTVLSNDTIGDTITIKYKKRYKVFLGNDTIFCGAFSHLLNAGKSAQSYKWNTGDTTVKKLVNNPGMYSVTIKDTNTCPIGDTILIGQLKKPVVTIGYDSVNCTFVMLSVAPQDSGITYRWDTGDTGRRITVSQKGLYSITLSNLFCSITATVNVQLLAMPTVNLGPDTVICRNDHITLTTGDSGIFYWSTGETTPQIRVRDKGKYWVTVNRNGCSATDSVYVDDCNDWFYIPNAFSPDNTGLNDVFGVVGENIVAIDMKIFDRWGENIFNGRGTEVYWDGTYQSLPCPSGVYTYLISITGYKGGRLMKENLTGTVTLLR